MDGKRPGFEDVARSKRVAVHSRGLQDGQTQSGRAAARTKSHQAICRAVAVLGGYRPRSEGNLASDNENITTTEIPPQEPMAQEKTAAPPARDTAADKTDEAARPQRHPKGDRPHRDKGEH